MVEQFYYTAEFSPAGGVGSDGSMSNQDVPIDVIIATMTGATIDAGVISEKYTGPLVGGQPIW
jgi:hypothetical protein